MVVRCPVDGCATITVKDLPKDYNFERDREKHRYSLIETSQKLKQKVFQSGRKSGDKRKRKASKNFKSKVEAAVDLSESSFIVDNSGARAVVDLFLCSIFKGIGVLYVVAIVGVTSGFAFGFDIGYSHTLMSFANHDGKMIFSVLLCALFSVEIAASSTGLKFLTQSTFLGGLDTLTIVMLGVAVVGKLDFGYCHSFDRYLVMFTCKYAVSLLVGCMVAVEVALVMGHYATALGKSISTRMQRMGRLKLDSPLVGSDDSSPTTAGSVDGTTPSKTVALSPKKDFEFTYMTPTKAQASEQGAHMSSSDGSENSDDFGSQPVQSADTASAEVSAGNVPDSAMRSPHTEQDPGSVRKKVDFDLQDYSCGVTPFNSTATSATSMDEEGDCVGKTAADWNAVNAAEKSHFFPHDFTATSATDTQGLALSGSAQKGMHAAMPSPGLHTPTDDTDSDVEVQSNGNVRYKHGALDTTPYSISISSTDTSVACYSSPPLGAFGGASATSSAMKNGENDVTQDVFATEEATPSETDKGRRGIAFSYGTPNALSSASCGIDKAYGGTIGDNSNGNTSSRDVSRNTTVEDNNSTTSIDRYCGSYSFGDSTGRMRAHQAVARSFTATTDNAPAHAHANTADLHFSSTYKDVSLQSTYNPLNAYSSNPEPTTPEYTQTTPQKSRVGAPNCFESPEEEEFKLHSNIKLKPLGPFANSHGGSGNSLLGGGSLRGNQQQVRVCDLAGEGAEAGGEGQDLEQEQDLEHTYLLGTTNFSNPASPAAAAHVSTQMLQAADQAFPNIYGSTDMGKGTGFKVSELVNSFEKKSVTCAAFEMSRGKAENPLLSKSASATSKVKVCGKDCVNSKLLKGTTSALPLGGGKKTSTTAGLFGGGLSNLIR